MKRSEKWTNEEDFFSDEGEEPVNVMRWKEREETNSTTGENEIMMNFCGRMQKSFLVFLGVASDDSQLFRVLL